MENEELLSKYALALKDIEKAIEENVDYEDLQRIMKIAEYYKEEIIRRMNNGR